MNAFPAGGDDRFAVRQERHTFHPVLQARQRENIQGLLRSIPRLGSSRDRKDRLDVIEGMVPNLLHLPRGCAFAPRCAKRTEECTASEIALEPLNERQEVRCIHA